MALHRQKGQVTPEDDLGNGSPASHDQYTIAWICALPIEMAAARAMLDDVHQDLPRHTNDTNTYTLGNVQRHNVVVACLPTAQYGTNNAANVLTHLIRTFPSICLGLMVGIGGGVPSKVDMQVTRFVNALRVYATKDRVNEYNHYHLDRLSRPVIQVMAKNVGPGAAAAPDDKAMLTSNLWQPVGLCNGARGTVYDIGWAPGADPIR
ncbi:hypothetical protein EDB81DRAFT_953098 [Dactylonectria macrodidyma]|uniref:Nucleoside phosphorylase domain-containing protein n=1 Tax=Dactylonectria macrodidyma TaxID=307937 RepID=A0A9P9D8G6_9HYPO|nr:hypothetical protein EDB81DRAFT_953098 [Dactylonectria macrodidyma]